jgi:glycosyltransferase involved in cell wall biosynthesis
MSGPPRVSVVVAVFERKERTLACLGTLLAQTLTDAEIVVVDDGSEDGTADAVEALAAGGGRIPIRLLRNGVNRGANASRNRGSEAARAPVVAFLDSDCLADPDWLEELVRPFADPRVGAVSGLVEDTCRDNMWELAFSGTHRLPRRGPSSRLTSCNLAVRRELVAGGRWDESRPTRRTPDGARPDTAISARCDEEGLNLGIRAAGWKVLAEPAARVRHVHPYTRRSLLRQAFYGGCSVAEIVWKYRLPPRRDLAPMFAAWLAVPIAAALHRATGHGEWWLAPAGLGLVAAAAVAWNERYMKGKTPVELLRSAPALVVYYHVRMAGYLFRRAQIASGQCRPMRVDRASLAAAFPAPPGAGG